jgi:hypothetical protein
MPTPARLLSVVFVATLSIDALAQSSQTLPAGFDNVQGASGTAFPFNQTASHKWQWHYDNSNFTQSGPIRITQIYLRALTTAQTIAAFDFPSVTVTCSAATTDYRVGAHDTVFANNLGANTQVVRSGPWTGGPVPPSGGATATWIPIGVTAPFLYDPTSGDDFIVQIEKCGTNATFGGSIDGRAGGVGVVLGNRYGHLSDCVAPTQNSNNNEYVPILRIDYTDATSGPTVYCTSGTTSSGCLPSMSFSGTPSASATSGFMLDVSAVEGQKQGLIFYGINNNGFAPLPWGTSFFCVKSPTQRSIPQSSGGTPGGCDGAFALDWNAYRQANPGALGQPFGVGQPVYAQAWFRDPQGVKTTAFSDALEFAVGP